MFNRLSIPVQVILLLCFFGLLPALVITGVLIAERPALENQQLKTFRAYAESLTNIIDRNLFERYGDVQAFAKNETMQAFAGEGFERSPQSRIVSAMNTYTDLYDIYNLMLLVDLEGNVVAVNSRTANGEPLATEKIYHQNFKSDEWFKKAMAGDFLPGRNGLTGTVVLPAVLDKNVATLYGSEGMVTVFSAPVQNQDGKTIGVYANFAGFALVNDIVRKYYELIAASGIKSTELTVLDDKGNILVDYDPLLTGSHDVKFNPDIILKFNLVEKNVLAAVNAVAGNNGAMFAHHARKNIDQAAGYAHSQGAYDFPGLGWSVLVRADKGEVLADIQAISHVISLLIGVILVILLFLGLFVGRMFAKPFKQLSHVMAALLQGELSVSIPYVKRPNEVGGMARAIEVFRDNLVENEKLRAGQAEAEIRAEEDKRKAMHQLADELEFTVNSIVSSSANIATQLCLYADSMAVASKNAMSDAEMVSHASNEASSNVAAVAAASEELSSSITEIMRQMQVSTATATTATKEAESTNVTVTGMSEAAQKIGDVVQLISEIASQTNLLALNATIEAARAGDAGKGFAVVASEVKNLASQTARATEEITSQITGMQTVSSEVVEAIKKVGSTIARINATSGTVCVAIEDQSTATQEISNNVQNAATSTERVSEAIGKITGVVESINALSQDVFKASTTLSQETTSLRERVIKFVEGIRAA